MKRTFRILASLALAMTLLLAGCGEGTPEADFTFITGTEHHDLDPAKISWLHDSRLIEQMFEPLVVYDFNLMQVTPGVASKWEVSDDGRTYTFQLRDDARWSNGDPVTAPDFLYAWQRAMMPDMAADYTKLLLHIEGAQRFFDWRTAQLEEYANKKAAGETDLPSAEAMLQVTHEAFREMVGVSAPDSQTLIVELETPLPYFLELVGHVVFTPVHAASVEAATEADGATAMVQTDPRYWTDPARLVTNGPYTLAATKFQQYTLLQANPHYWNAPAVRNKRVLERIISDPQNALLTYQNGGADFWADIPSASRLSADLLAQDRDDVHSQPMAGIYFYNFNCLPTLSDGSKNPLADARVRRALSMAIDRSVLVGRITRMNQPVAMSFVPPDVLPTYHPPVQEGVGLDLVQAKSLLTEAGYPGGEGLTGLSILYNTNMGHESIAQAIAEMWKQNLGVVVTLEGLRSKAFGQRLKSQQYTIARASWFGDYPDPATWLEKMTTDDGNNDCGWSDAQYDALIEQSASERDRAQRMKLLQQAEAILLREQPMALLFQYVNVYTWRPSVRGIETNPWATWYFDRVSVER